MKDIEIITFEKISNKSYRALGKINGKDFEARTIIHNGSPIFKVYEDEKIKKTKDPESNFSLGERMSIASFLKNYAKGKIDKEGRKIDNVKNPGIGISIKLQNKIDFLELKIKKLEECLASNNIDISGLFDNKIDDDEEKLIQEDAIEENEDESNSMGEDE